MFLWIMLVLIVYSIHRKKRKEDVEEKKALKKVHGERENETRKDNEWI